jgi:hypothetical protein
MSRGNWRFLLTNLLAQIRGVTALSLESRALFFTIDNSAVVASGLIQPVSTICQTSIDFKKKHIRTF